MTAGRLGRALRAVRQRLSADRGDRSAPDWFDPASYLAAHPDVAAQGMDPWTHWRRFGRHEGRVPAETRAEGLLAALRRGFPAGARGALEGIAWREGAAGSAFERASALWALARHDDETGGDPRPALRALLAMPHWREPAGGRGPDLMAALRLPAGERPAPLDMAKGPDLVLAEGGDGLSLALGRLWQEAGLAPARLAPGPGPALDRLSADPAGREESGTLVTVIMPCHAAARTLPAALRSVLSQSHAALEVLLVANGPGDAIGAEARAIAEADPRVRLLRCEETGAYPARNLGLSQARGEAVTVQDADDWSHPSRIALQLAALGGGAMASMSHWLRVTEDLDPVPNWREGGLVHRNASSLMIRTTLRESLGYWDRVRADADTEYWYRLMAVHGRQAIAEVRPGLPLALGRISEGGLTRNAATTLATRDWGPRRSYQEAAADWHRSFAGGASPHLAERPRSRPFDAPPELSIDPPLAADPPRAGRLRRSPLMDPAWYLERYPDLGAADVDAARHYLEAGADEGRDPGPGFSSSGWQAAARELGGAPADPNPLLDYEARGRPSGRPPLYRRRGGHDAKPGAPMLFGHLAGPLTFGAERSFLDMLDRLVEADTPAHAVLPHLYAPDYAREIMSRAASLSVLPYGWWHAERVTPDGTALALDALIADVAPEEVQVNTLTILSPLEAARRAGLPGILHLREMPEGDEALCETLGAGPDAIRERLHACADRFVANSPLAAEWLGAPGRTAVRLNRVDPALLDLPAPVEAGSAGPLVAALIGSNDARKGLEEAIAIAGRLDPAAVRLRLVGPVPDRALPPAAEAPGPAPGPAAALEGVDLVLSLSRFAESFGRTVLEGLAAGRPALVWDRGHPPELVGRDGLAGIVRPAGDVEGAARELSDLAGDRARLATMSRAARARARLLIDGAQ